MTRFISARGLSWLPDDDVFALALREKRIIVTADLDFSRIVAFAVQALPGLVLFRGAITDNQMKEYLERVLSHVAPSEFENAVVVVEPSRFRVARLPFAK